MFDPKIYLPAGTEIREDVTNDLICTVIDDLLVDQTAYPSSFAWTWPRPESSGTFGTAFAIAIQKARDRVLMGGVDYSAKALAEMEADHV